MENYIKKKKKRENILKANESVGSYKPIKLVPLNY